MFRLLKFYEHSNIRYKNRAWGTHSVKMGPKVPTQRQDVCSVPNKLQPGELRDFMAPGAWSNFGTSVFAPNLRSFGSKCMLHWRKYLWHCWDFSKLWGRRNTAGEAEWLRGIWKSPNS